MAICVRDAMYSGNIKGVGPRYCPSIEDKIIKFKEKQNIKFFKPEGLKDNTVYPNGISTSYQRRSNSKYCVKSRFGKCFK